MLVDIVLVILGSVALAALAIAFKPDRSGPQEFESNNDKIAS